MVRKNRNRNPNNKSTEGRPRPIVPYQTIIKENQAFLKYYIKQNVCHQGEWTEFIDVLKTDLPSTFRITGSKEEAKRLVQIVEEQLMNDCVHEVSDGMLPAVIAPVPWYPDKLVWQMELSRKDIRRNEANLKLHNFLVSESNHGTISRQETVSMIPALFLDVKPDHKVLDMCAAPGSKTKQIIEMLHGDGDDVLPKGYVVATDIDPKRCYKLVHQCKLLNSPCLAVMNHDSAIFPNLYETTLDGSTIQRVEYDRVLCDVPCSGDGTIRKNPSIWKKWTPSNCLDQHIVQTRILRRGVELVKVGGRVVYSTCSLNPIENEAVIHKVLSETGGAIQLVDCNALLPELIRSPGLESWFVANKFLEFFELYDQVPDQWRNNIKQGMFPPKYADKDKFNLHRCMRVLPHKQNTGAFFVAVLEKVKPINLKEITQPPQNSALNSADELLGVQGGSADSNKRENDSQQGGRRKKRRFEGYRENPFLFFEGDEDIWPAIKSYYGISNDIDPKCLLTRCYGPKKKNIYFISPAMRDLMINNRCLKFVNAGVKTFVRSDNRNMECAFRLAHEGIESMYQFMGVNRKVEIPKDDFITLLSAEDPAKPPAISSLSTEVQEQVEKLTPGSCILIYKDENTEHPLVLHVNGWRGTHSLRCYTSLHTTVHLLRLLGGDLSKYTVNKFKKLVVVDDGVEQNADAAEREENDSASD